MILDTNEIRAARERRGWTQDQLARASEVGVSLISRIEQGAEARSVTLRKLTRALNVDIKAPTQ